MKKAFEKTVLFFAAGISLVLIPFACNLEVIKDMIVELGPQASFTVQPASCDAAPCEVSITNNSEGATRWDWDFGDTKTFSGENPGAHTYTSAGSFKIRLIVTGANNLRDTAEVTVNVGSGVKPTANFTFTNDGCIAPCTITFTNTSTNALSSVWDFRDGQTSPALSPSHLFEAPGVYSVKLKVFNGTNVDSIEKNVTINGVPTFKTPLNLSALNVTPYCATERSDGKFHLLYNQSGIKSALVNTVGAVEGTPVSLPLTMAVNQTRAHNGGFLISGELSGTAKVGVLDELQAVKANKPFSFNSNTSSGMGMIVNDAGELVVTGLRQSPTPLYVGFARLSGDGNSILANPLIQPTGLENYGGISIVQRTTNDYFITANILSPPGGKEALLLSITTTGNYNTKYPLTPLNFASKIIRTAGNSYAVIGRSSAGLVYVLGINSNGTIAWERQLSITSISDIIFTEDAQLAVCGTKSGALYWAKFPAISGSAFTWERTASGANGSITGISIHQTADGGYLILGQYDNAGKTEPYLVKTDPSGEVK